MTPEGTRGRNVRAFLWVRTAESARLYIKMDVGTIVMGLALIGIGGAISVGGSTLTVPQPDSAGVAIIIVGLLIAGLGVIRTLGDILGMKRDAKGNPKP